MKLKINSPSFFRELLRNQKWFMLVTTVITFLMYPVALIMELIRYEERGIIGSSLLTNMERYLSYYGDFSYGLSSYSVTILFITIAIGVAAGILSFGYLHNKVQAGLYHSIPVRREELLWDKFIVFLISYVLPLILANIVFVIILVTRGLYTTIIMQQLLVLLYYHIMMFIIAYCVAAIAMLLTGKIMVGILGACVLIGYCPVLAVTLSGYVNQFFYHYHAEGHAIWGSFEILARISPFTFVEIIEINCLWQVGLVLLVAIILWFIHLKLMLIRPIEAAGQSMAYHKVGCVIQGALLFLGTIGFGIFIYEIFYNKVPYLYLGAIFGCICIYIITQFLYGVEIRNLFKKNKMFLTIGSISILLILTVQCDRIGYNTWLPDYDQIVDINLECTEKQAYSTLILEEGLYEAHMGKDETTYALVETIIESSQNNYAEKNNYLEETIYIYVEYQLESGRIVRREYYPALDEVKEALKYLWSKEEFLNVAYPIRIQDASLGNNVKFDTMVNSTMDTASAFSDNEELEKLFLEAYQKDALEIDRTIVEEIPIGSFSYYLQGTEFNDYYLAYIYPSFTYTLAFLEEQNITMYYEILPEDVASIEIYNLEENSETVETALIEDDSLYYTDISSIEILLKELVPNELETIFMELEESKYAYVNLEDGSSIYYNFFIE